MNLSRRSKILFVLGFIVLALLFSSEVSTTATYINASYIIGVGFSANSTNNVSLISEMNNGHWEGNETNTQGWDVYVYFYNVTSFNMVETTHRYFSISGTPSNHIVSRDIWCETHQDFIELEDYSNEDDWFYNSKHIPDSSHFIMPNGTVIIRYHHAANGNTNHRIWLDVVRLVQLESAISISNITTTTALTQETQDYYKYDYVISNTTGTIQVYNTSSNSFLAGSYTPKSAIEATMGYSMLLQGRFNVASQINITQSNTKIECTDNTPNLFLNDNVNASMFYVTSNNFEISHCNIDMNGANNAFPLNIEGAVYLVNANGTKIHDNNFSSDNYPVGDDGSLIYADFTSYNNSIVNNILTGGRNNIFAYNYNTIQGNIMSGGSHTCIYLRSGRYNTVTGNTCEYASSGVGIEGDTGSDAYGNVVSDNVFYTMTGGSGVAIINTTGNSIIGNTCDQIQFNCIRITGSSNNTITSNTGNHMSKTTSSNQGGIYLINNSGAPSSNNTIASNTMIGPGQEYGVLIANPTVNPGNKIFLNNVISSSVADYGGLTLGNQAYFYYNGTCFISSNDAGAACI